MGQRDSKDSTRRFNRHKEESILGTRKIPTYLSNHPREQPPKHGPRPLDLPVDDDLRPWRVYETASNTLSRARWLKNLYVQSGMCLYNNLKLNERTNLT